MAGELIDHIGILVPDLEAAIARWSGALGYEFSPIGRYRTNLYRDQSNPEPHFHDTRICFSKQGPPYIELLEVTGDGTHALGQAGVHHLGIRGIDDVAGEIRRCAALGIGEDGHSILEDGRLHLWFTEKSGLDGVRLEFIAPIPGPTVADDGSELWADPVTGLKSLWGKP